MSEGYLSEENARKVVKKLDPTETMPHFLLSEHFLVKGQILTITQSPHSLDINPCDFWIFYMMLKGSFCDSRSGSHNRRGLSEMLEHCVRAEEQYFKNDKASLHIHFTKLANVTDEVLNEHLPNAQ
jgi:hypothetical protein